jgi:hypothetical protein
MKARILATVLTGLAAHAAMADEVVLDASKDNSLFSESSTLSNGAGARLFCGRVAPQGGGALRRALLAFDVAGNVPPGATIDSVELTLNMSRSIAGAEPCSISALTTDWGEGASDAPGQEGRGAPAQPGDATWDHTFFDTDFWTTDGGDFEAVPDATIDVAGNGFYTWGTNAAMVSRVQFWLDTPASNFGWILIGNEAELTTAKRFDSRENVTEANRPRLRVVFTPSSGGETICPDDPNDFLKSFGGTVSGDALDLCVADDTRLEVRQFARVSPLLPFIRLEYWAHSSLGDGVITSVAYKIEAHVSALVAGGQNSNTLRTRIKNYGTGIFELVDQRGTSSNTDETIEHLQDTDAADYVQSGDGEVRVRQDAFDPGNVFSPNWFLKVDLYEVTISS